jgi:hypothetical protein
MEVFDEAKVEACSHGAKIAVGQIQWNHHWFVVDDAYEGRIG